MNEFYKKYRPTELSDVTGQPEAIAMLTDMVARRKVPHAILFSGSSGCGKTTLARILRAKIGCGDADYKEMNAAEARGIDDVRAVQDRMGLAPMSGRCRVWLWDEAHKLTPDAQGCLLKILEDTPKHVYFMLATTDPGKLISTVKNRCTEIKVKPMTPAVIKALVLKVAAAEGLTTSEVVAAQIADTSEGSARRALVILNQIAGIPDEAGQLAAVQSGDFKTEAFSIARALMAPQPPSWPDVAKLINGLEGEKEDWEGIRWMILGYCNKVILGAGKQADLAFFVSQCFKHNWYDTKKNGLICSCYDVVTARNKKK